MDIGIDSMVYGKSDFYKNLNIPIRIVETTEKPISTKYNSSSIIIGENGVLFRSFDFD